MDNRILLNKTDGAMPYLSLEMNSQKGNQERFVGGELGSFGS